MHVLGFPPLLTDIFMHLTGLIALQVFGLYFMQSYIGIFYHALLHRSFLTLRQVLIQRLLVSEVKYKDKFAVLVSTACINVLENLTFGRCWKTCWRILYLILNIVIRNIDSGKLSICLPYLVGYLNFV